MQVTGWRSSVAGGQMIGRETGALHVLPAFELEMRMGEEPDWNRGVGVAAISLMSALLEKMRSQGTFTRTEIAEMIGTALIYTDLFNRDGVATPDTQTAVAILEDMRRSYRDDVAMGE